MIKSQVSCGERANIKCGFKKEGLICPQIATVDLYGKEVSGYFCLKYADEIIELYKNSDPIPVGGGNLTSEAFHLKLK